MLAAYQTVNQKTLLWNCLMIHMAPLVVELVAYYCQRVILSSSVLYSLSELFVALQVAPIKYWARVGWKSRRGQENYTDDLPAGYTLAHNILLGKYL